MTIRIPPESPAANIIVRLLYPAETTYKMPVSTGYSVYLFSMDAFQRQKFPKGRKLLPKSIYEQEFHTYATVFASFLV